MHLKIVEIINFMYILTQKKLAKNPNRHFCKEDVQIANKEKWIYVQCD